MNYVISGASAALGKLVADNLLEVIPPSKLTLISRNPQALESYRSKGVTIRKGHHGDLESLKAGYKGTDRLFMISSLAVGKRKIEHRNAIEAAKSVGIQHITYTSVAGAHPANPTPSATDHTATERMLWESGISFAALRNQMYSELFYGMIIDQALRTGTWKHNADQGGFSPVSRIDIAACVSEIMLAPEQHDRVVYEITGNERWTFPKVAELAEKLWKKPITYIPVSDEEKYKIYEQRNVPFEGIPTSKNLAIALGADELVKQFRAYEMGLLDVVSAHVEFITGKKPIKFASTLQDMIDQWNTLKNQQKRAITK